MKHETQRRKEWIRPGELRPLLERLHAEDAEPEPEDDHTTIAAVCEATGESEKRVWELLEAIRNEDVEARISSRLREAEEPLYRVERPGPCNDPLSSKTWLGRQRAITTILDHLPRPHRPRVTKKQPHADTRPDRLSQWMSVLILFLVLGTLALIIIRALGKGMI